MDADRESPPGTDSVPLQALWWEARGDWHRAHQAIAEERGRDAAWVHAYLHRREGDFGNAAYWYARAGKPASSLPLDDERLTIVAALRGAR